MNKIVFAGKISTSVTARTDTNKYLNIIATAKDCTGGAIIFSNKKLDFCAGKIIAVPPNVSYTLSSPHPDDLHIYIERPVLGLKAPAVIDDVENLGIRHAAGQAEIFFNAGEKNDAVLAALGNLIVSYVAAGLGQEKKYSPAVGLVCEDISKNLSNSAYALDDFIKNLPLNYDYVRKLFKKEVGLTPREYLEGQRMELAVKLLTSGISNKYSNYSVSQIAEACGYAEPLYFSRVFKKRYGVSPSMYK